MMDTATWTLVQTTLQRAWLLWGGLLATLVVYLVIAERVGPVAAWPLGSRSPVLLYAVAGLCVAAGVGLRRVLLQGGAASDAGQLAGRYLVALVVSVSLCETVAVLALVLMLLGLSRDTGLGLILVAALAMLWLRPRREELERLLMRRA